MTEGVLDIVKGHIYRAKKPRTNGLGELNDRQVVYVSPTQVQYDSSTVRQGAKFPLVSREQFEKWAGEDVTEGYPKGEWATRSDP